MEIPCAVLLVILTHLVTCFPGIECGSGIMLEGVGADSIFAPPYKTKTLSAGMKDPKSNCVYPNSSLTFFRFSPVDVCGLLKIFYSVCVLLLLLSSSPSLHTLQRKPRQH